MDKPKIDITKLTMLAECQITYLFDDRINGILPLWLNWGGLGLNYGFGLRNFRDGSIYRGMEKCKF